MPYDATGSYIPEPQTVPTDDIADVPFSELFPADEGLPTTTSADSAARTSQGLTAGMTPQQAEEFFLQGAKSVYKTREAAIEGINAKDALIEELRSKIPQAQPQPPATPTNEIPNYVQDPNKFYEAQVAAVNKNDPKAYADTLATFVNQLMAPYLPVIATSVKSQAVERVSTELKDFREVHDSEAFSKVLDTLPKLKEAIAIAESNPQMADVLPEFYKVAYLATRGSQLPELLKAAQASGAPSPQPVRPTMTSGPAMPATSRGALDLTTSEGRQQYIKDMEGRGILDVPVR